MKSAVLLTLALFLAQVAAASDTGTGIGLDITPEEFEPRIWLCGDRVVLDDAVEEGRGSNAGTELVERTNNYAFEGEQISWEALVMDKNNVGEITDVIATLGSVQGTGNAVEVECGRATAPDEIPATCAARILEEDLTGTAFDRDTQDWYQCTLTVESAASMAGEFFITLEVISVDGEATVDENEYWFLNPVIGITVDGDLSFDNVRPGTVAYSDTLVVSNDAESGSGVLLDMFITGTDFYDPSSSGAKCPVSNRLKLGRNSRGGQVDAPACNADTDGLRFDFADHICYYAANGAYTSASAPDADAEGYRPILYGDHFTRDFYDTAEIISNDLADFNGIIYDAGNVLSPGADIAITFKLGLPEPCVGDFSEGSIFFWGEAI